MADSSRRRWLLVVPNLLTGLRLGLTIAFPFIDPPWWPIVIVIAGGSDLADGLIARAFNLSTWIGAMLDAVADKAFTLTVLITYILTGRLAWWMVALLFLRDIAVGIAAAFTIAHRQWNAFRLMSSRWYGKVTTAVIFALLLVVALWPQARTTIVTLVAIGAASSLAAAVDYLTQFLQVHARWKRGGLGRFYSPNDGSAM